MDATTTIISMAAAAAGGTAPPAPVQPQLQQQMQITDPITVTSVFLIIKPLIVYPVRWTGRLLLLLSRPILYVLNWLAWPFISLANGIHALLSLPFALLVKFEAILTFLLVAAAIGALTGSILYFTSSFTNTAFGLDGPEEKQVKLKYSTLEDDSASVRSVADFRASRKAKKGKDKQRLIPISSPREEKMFQDLLSKVDYLPSSDAGPQGRYSISNQTILEEDDSSSFEQV